MGKEQRSFSRKKKLVGAIASTAMIAVPFLTVPAAANVETEIPILNHDKLQTIVIPEGGKTYINLHTLYYAGREFQINNTSTLATVNQSLLRYGILEINANPLVTNSPTGLATFTVTVTPYESEATFDDTFNVIIVPSSGSGTGPNFNIKNVVSVLQNFPSQYSEKSKIEELMGHIDLASPTIKKDDPYSQPGNQIPVPKMNVTPFEAFSGVDVDVNSYGESPLSFDIHQFYEDPDDESNEFNENSYLHVVFATSGNEYIRVNNTEYGQTLTPLQATSEPVYLPVVVYDNEGGVVSGTVPILVRPSERFDIEERASITLDMHNYFNNVDDSSYIDMEIINISEGFGSLPSIDGTHVTLSPLNGIYKFKHMKADSEQESICFVVKENYDLYENELSKSFLYENSTLEFDLNQMFPQEAGASVQYSVYHENPSITSITYGIDLTEGNKLSFTASKDAANGVTNEEQQAPNNFTIIAKDVVNHHTYVDRINIAPRNRDDSHYTIFPDKLFDWQSKGEDVTVSSTDSDYHFTIQHGCSVYVQGDNLPPNTSTTVVLTLENGKVVYKIPYTSYGPA
ncbi:hypothetical protein HZF08_36550 [Paenibacillus sp. CGMCC 1.16610]|uniref:Uncharacterized protein n=1 Tax=Paenibacillus anseongense TaxID=2682845 RepID=A0ABW9UE01_9BACL|nr:MULTISPECIES: hypothetical protein [Paenibacillus]MBA2943787.1 hypothetical protein [Paenibacillus sp. CGMCC 1.16610]MVQ37676.1 hypothetical protein [Paenibacillus anseongense]